MKSGAYFSAIFAIWIIGIVFAIYIFLPDINNSINALNELDLENSTALVSDATHTEQSIPKNATAYTPLGIFDLIKN